MKSKFLPIIIGIAGAAMTLPGSAAVIAWGSVQAITGAGNIISTGVTSLAGANFGIPTGTTTIVNNGVVDVEFKSLRSGENATLSNGITVAAAASWENWGFQGAVSSIGGTFETVLDSNLGDETNPLTSTITLSDLTVGTLYQIQFFADSTGNNGQTIEGSSTMNSRTGQFVTGTFTADATSQMLTVTSTSGGFAVANALTVGQSIPEPSAAALLGLGGLTLLRRRRN